MFLIGVRAYEKLILAMICLNFLFAGRVYGQPDSLTIKKMESFFRQGRELHTEGKLEYRISLLKDTFLLYEQVLAEMWVKNISRDTVRVFDPTLEDWSIEDEAGKKYPPKVLNDVIRNRLYPGDSLGGIIGINHYGVDMPPPFPYHRFPLGKYKATYKGKGFVFYVVEPKGENAEALKLYLQAFEPYWGGSFSRATPAERIELGKEEVRRLLLVADRFPQSPYANAALTGALVSAWSSAGDAKLSHELTLRVLRENPQMNWTYLHFLDAYYESRGDTLGFRNELDSIITANSHPRLSAAARRELKKLEVEK